LPGDGRLPGGSGDPLHGVDLTAGAGRLPEQSGVRAGAAPVRPALPRPAAAELLTWTAFGAGLLLIALMVARSQVGGDQLNLLARGWLLAVRHRMIWFGNPLSTGGKVPGGVTSLLVGLPLLLWRDHRAATALVALCHVMAFLVLDRTLARIVSAPERLLFAVFYWLSPWQLYFASFLWNPNYLFLGGAVHLATAWRLRREAHLPAAVLHVATLIVGLQVHPSFLLLVAASALLAWRGYLRLHPWGVVLGAVLGCVPLVPWAWEVLTHPVLLAEVHKGFPGRGLVFSLPRGVLYWLRYSSLSLAGRTGLFDFSEAFGATASRSLTPFFRGLTEGVGPATIVLPLAANLWLWRRHLGTRRGNGTWWRRLLRRPAAGAGGRAWLRGYVLLTFLAAVAVYAVSPTTFMYWQGLCLFPAAVLPLVLYAGAVRRSRRGARVAAGVAAWAAVEVVLTLGIAFGTPDFRCRGRDTVVFPLRHDSPMLHDLRIQDTCPWPTGDPHGWWPDVLPVPALTVPGSRDRPAGPILGRR
jgi:hypothetical protein